MYEHLIEEYSAASAQIVEGERRDGVVVSVTDEGAVIDIGGKTEAMLQRSRAPQDFDWSALQPGTEVAVFVASLGSPGEYAQVGIAREENTAAWDALARSCMRHRRDCRCESDGVQWSCRCPGQATGGGVTVIAAGFDLRSGTLIDRRDGREIRTVARVEREAVTGWQLADAAQDTAADADGGLLGPKLSVESFRPPRNVRRMLVITCRSKSGDQFSPLARFCLRSSILVRSVSRTPAW